MGGRFGREGYLILDDTGFPKQGQHSVGVARQYTGTLGKVASCQVAVTLQLATDREVLGLDARLYLPQAWADDRKRCKKSGIPADVAYQPKWQLALAMLRRAHVNGLQGTVLADSLFGTVTEFRQQLAAEGWTYCVGIDSTLKVIAADADLGPVPKYSGRGQPPKRPLKVRAEANIAERQTVGRRTCCRLPQSDLARGDERQDGGALRCLASPTGAQTLGRKRAAGRVLVAGRMAGRFRAPGEVLFQQLASPRRASNDW